MNINTPIQPLLNRSHDNDLNSRSESPPQRPIPATEPAHPRLLGTKMPGWFNKGGPQGGEQPAAPVDGAPPTYRDYERELDPSVRQVTGTPDARAAMPLHRSWLARLLGQSQTPASNVEWEDERGPLPVKDKLSLRVLNLHQDKVANGNFGYVSIFENENGQKVIGKVSRGRMFDVPERRFVKRRFHNGKKEIVTKRKVDDLALELDAYQRIYNAVGVGPHRNLVNAYGIATVRYRKNIRVATTRMMLMEHIDGTTGKKFFDDLRQCWKHGKITSEEYWSVVQFMARRILDATEHISKAGLVHNDIKLENIMIDATSSEPILIDLGLWSNHGARNVGGTAVFRSDDRLKIGGVDERSDVFTVVAALIGGVEGLKAVRGSDGEWKNNFIPNQGLRKTEIRRDAQGQAEHVPGNYSVTTAYTNFAQDGLEMNKRLRLPPTAEPGSREASPSARAKALPFLSDSMLDENDERAMEKIRATIQKTMKIGAEERAKPGNQRWKKSVPKVSAERRRRTDMDIQAFKANPTLDGLARLSTGARTDPKAQSYIEKITPTMRKRLIEEAAHIGRTLTIDHVRFNTLLEEVNAMSALNFVQKSGVDANGVRKREVSDNEEERRRKASRIMARLSPDDLSAMRAYMQDAKAFLHKVSMIKGKGAESLDRITQSVRNRARIASSIVEIEDINVAMQVKEKAGELTPKFDTDEFKRILARRRELAHQQRSTNR